MLHRIIKEERDTDLALKAKKMLSENIDKDRLNHAIYGLKQAGRQWYKQINKTLKSIGLTSTKSHPCVFIDNTDNTQIIVLIYIDDILIAFNNSGKVNMIKIELTKRFKIKDLGGARYCLGIEILQNNDGI